MAVDVDTALSFFSLQYAYVPVQTKAQKDADEGTEPRYLSYDHFTDYYNLAIEELAADLLNRGGLVITDTQTKAALCHLIADYCEMANPDWSYTQQSISSGEGLPTINISRGQHTSPRLAYNKLLEIIERAARHAPKPFNGSGNVDNIFYRGMMQSGGVVLDRYHSDWPIE
jgi:hypothetical protein